MILSQVVATIKNWLSGKVASGERVLTATSADVFATYELQEQIQGNVANLMAATYSINEIATVAGVKGWVQYSSDNQYRYECIDTNTWQRTPVGMRRVNLFIGGVSDAAGIKTSAQMVALYPAAIDYQYAKGESGIYQFISGVWLYYQGTSTGVFTLLDGSVTYAKIQNVTTARIMGRATAGSGVMEELTGTQATSLLNTFGSSTKGLVSGSGGGNDKVLISDGNWVRRNRTLGVYTTLLSYTGGSETDYHAPVVPANTLEVNGDKAIYTFTYGAAGSGAGTVNGYVYFGGTKVADFVTLTDGSYNETIRVIVTRLSSSTAYAQAIREGSFGSFKNSYTELTGLDFTSPIVFKSTLTQAGSLEALGIIGELEFKPAP